jgi:hypothetical protein
MGNAEELIILSLVAMLLIRFILAMNLLTLTESKGESNYFQRNLSATLIQWFFPKEGYTEGVNRWIKIQNILSIILLRGVMFFCLFYFLK